MSNSMPHFRTAAYVLLFAALVSLTGCSGGGGATGPKEAAVAYLRALRTNDIHAAEAALAVHGSGGGAARDLYVELILVPRQLDAACREKLGQPAATGRDSGALDDRTIDAAIQAVQSAQVDVKGDAATIHAG